MPKMFGKNMTARHQEEGSFIAGVEQEDCRAAKFFNDVSLQRFPSASVGQKRGPANEGAARPGRQQCWLDAVSGRRSTRNP
jgi:hypothetical protein